MGDDIVKCLRINFDEELLLWRDFNSDLNSLQNLAVFRLNNVSLERVKLAV